MKIETVINMAVTAVMCDMKLPRELKTEIINGLRECEDLESIGIIAKREEKSAKDTKIEELEKRMRELADEIAGLKGV